MTPQRLYGKRRKHKGQERRKGDNMLTREEILQSNGVSFWAKNALRELEKRDIVDALKDIEGLKQYFTERFNKNA